MKTKLKPEVLKAIRLKLGMTQAEMAIALEISRVSVNHMETNKLRKGIPDRIPAKLAELAQRHWETDPNSRLCRLAREEPGGGPPPLPQAAEVVPLLSQTKPPARKAAEDALLWENEEED